MITYWLFVVLVTTAGPYADNNTPAVMGPFKSTAECDAAAKTAVRTYGDLALAPPGRAIVVRTSCETIEQSRK